MSSSHDWVPQWAKKVVWYQIFPERFRRGNRNVRCERSLQPKTDDLGRHGISAGSLSA